MVAFTVRGRRNLLSYALGASAGFQTASLGHFHMFTLLALVYGFLPRSVEQPGVHKRRAAFIVVSTAVLCASTPYGALVTNRNLSVQFLLLALSAAAVLLNANAHDIRKICAGLLFVITSSSAIGVAQYVHLLPMTLFAGDPRPTGLYLEPDWLGLYAAVGLVMAIQGQYRNRYALIAVNSAALLLATARAAWLAVIVALMVGVLGFLLSREKWRRAGTVRALAISAVCLVLGFTSSGTLRTNIEHRVVAISSGSLDVSARARQQQHDGLLQLASQKPWHGFGISAEGRVGVSGRLDYGSGGGNSVASNWILGWWVDSGLLALPIITFFLCSALWRPSATANLMFLVVLTNSLFSNAVAYPLTWLTLALALTPAWTEVARKQRRFPTVSFSLVGRLADASTVNS